MKSCDTEDFLSSVRVQDLVPAGSSPIVGIDSTANVKEALEKLAQYNIYSAPVVDAKTQKPLGLIDVTDIATSLVLHMAAQFKVTLGQGKKSVEQFSLTAIQRNEISGVRQSFLSEPAVRVMNLSKQNAFHPRSMDTTLKDVLKALAQKDLNRVPIVDGSSNKVIRIVSQSAVIGFLSKHLDKLGDRVQQTIDQANIGTRPVVTIPAEFRAIDAFVMLIENRISAVGFLGEEGDVHGNISIKDIKGLLLDFNNLLLPVHEYINIIRNETVKDTPPMISVHTSDTVGKAIAKLAAVGIHRLYIFHEARSPIGIVSLADILRLFRPN